MAQTHHYCAIFLLLSSFLIFILIINVITPKESPLREVENVKLNYDIFTSPNLTNLEFIFCSSFGEQTTECTSVQSFFMLLKNGCTSKKKLHNKIPSNEIRLRDSKLGQLEENLLYIINKFNSSSFVNDLDGANNVENANSYEIKSDEHVVEMDTKNDAVEVKNNMAPLTYIIVSLLLMLSMLFALMEFWRERKRKRTSDESPDLAAPSEYNNGGRRLSIVDLTVSRHARRESQKRDSVTNYSSVGSHLSLRRNSFPVLIPDYIRTRPRVAPIRQQTYSPPKNGNIRKASIDQDDDDSSVSRRVRIIRRH